MCGRAARNARSAIKASARGAGWWKSRTRGSIDFANLLVRYEKLHRSYVALNMLAAAIITFRNIPAKVNIIYG